MQKLGSISALLLGLFLPFHGFFSLFLPSWAGLWKESLLVLLAIAPLFTKTGQKRIKTIFCSKIGKYSVLFFCLGGILLAFSSEKLRSALALRYLFTGIISFWVFTLQSQKNQHIFTKSLLCGSVLGAIFGIWAHFFNGYAILAEFYSSTLSSWVPGQAIPLFHYVNNVPRMQGGASGPVAFAHLCLVGLFVALLGVKNTKKSFSWQYYGVSAVLLVGIYFSASRAAILGAFVLLLWHVWHKKWQIWQNFPLKKKIIGIFCAFLLGIGSIVALINVNPQLLTRAGTSDHITKPIHAIFMGFEKPWGRLGQIGPAARHWNLKNLNTDKAFIAENVYADVFVQFGLAGLALFLLVLWHIWKKTDMYAKGYMVTFLLMGMFATIFDMTPVSIAMWGILGVLYKKIENCSSKKLHSSTKSL